MRIISTLIAAFFAVLGAAALAQQTPSEQTAAPTQVAVSPVETGTWKGTWNSNTSAATGDLSIQLISVTGDKVTGKLAMTRPSNNTWNCIDTPIDFTGSKQGDQMTVAVDFKGRCNRNEFKFTIKDGKLQGGYTTQSGSHGAYVLGRSDDVMALAK